MRPIWNFPNNDTAHTALCRAVRMDARSGLLLQLLKPTVQLLPVDADDQGVERLDGAGELHIPATDDLGRPV